jgi:hypothetical protein
MKYAFLGLLLGTLFSCSKNNNFYPVAGTLSVDIDGVPTLFTNCKGNLNRSDSFGGLTILAETADSSSVLRISLTDYHVPLGTRTYIDSFPLLSPRLSFDYDQQIVPHYNSYFLYISNDTLSAPVTSFTLTGIDYTTGNITIDSIQYPFTNPSAFRGTFNGEVTFAITNNLNIPVQHVLTHTFTNGKFNLLSTVGDY